MLTLTLLLVPSFLLHLLAPLSHPSFSHPLPPLVSHPLPPLVSRALSRSLAPSTPQFHPTDPLQEQTIFVYLTLTL